MDDPEAFVQLGHSYFDGVHGLPQDSNKAFELWPKGAELGSRKNGHDQVGVHTTRLGYQKGSKKGYSLLSACSNEGLCGIKVILGLAELNSGNAIEP